MKSRTRERLLEAAGEVFADRGFDAATGKEICARAGVAAAAVNYYFGGMQPLYEAVLSEARARLVSVDELARAVAAQATPEARLRAILATAARAAAGSAPSSWMVRLLGRELAAPRMGPALDPEARQRAGLLLRAVSDFMRLPLHHPAVARGCVSVLAPCLFLLIGDRGKLELVMPGLGAETEPVEAWTRHLTEYAMGGLAAIAAAHRDDRPAGS